MSEKGRNNPMSDVLDDLPHPVYAWMGWICALNPTEQLFEELKLHIQESYEYAMEKYFYIPKPIIFRRMGLRISKSTS